MFRFSNIILVPFVIALFSLSTYASENCFIAEENGKILKQWEGYPKVTTSQFVDEIKLLIDHGE